MADRTSLERDLRLLGGESAWPETPDLARAVVERVSGAPAASRVLRRGWALRPLALAALGLLIVAGSVMAASPSARDAVLELLGLRGATVERRERLPEPLPRGSRPVLGTRLSLAEARRAVSFPVLVPRELGPPDRVHLRAEVQGGELTLSYGPRRGLPATGATGLGLLVSQFRGDLAPDLIGKIASQGTRLRRPRVGDSAAVWIEGAPHVVLFREGNGEVVESESRLAGNVLLFERGRRLIRIEADVPLRRALTIARSLR